ncbi:hypothetical protein IGI37_001961 [Enterococcus sp. AZ194]|uniref:hypothetical protein n=1 Tax=Enterococcus sp. AZ194 TaxID=2774629 RepID=UPI003F254CD9
MTTELINQIIEEADNYLQELKVVEIPVSGYIDYLTTGERLSFENAYFARRRQAAVLVLAFIETKNQQIKPFFEQVLWEICNEYTWALPAHLPIEEEHYGKDASQWLDLFAAETGQMLAEIVELVGDDLTPLVRNRLISELERRILQPFERRSWDWESAKSNWSAVVGGSIGLVALSILHSDSVRQKKILEKVAKSMTAYLSSFGEDGACEEGLSYWAYGFGYYIYFAEKYARVLGDDRYLRLEKVKKIASFPAYVVINETEGIPFSDYHPAELPSGLVSFCREYFKVEVPAVKMVNDLDYDHCYRFAALYRNLLWTKEIDEGKKEGAHYFSDVEWGIFQSREENLVFAAKGGRNDESHNHIDVGQFVFGSFEELYLTDLGAGEYTKAYFDETIRYQFLVNGARGHSIPIVNSKEQQAGPYAAKNTRFEQVNNHFIFETDLAPTYQSEEISAITRTLTLNSIERTVFLRDKFEMTTPVNQVTECFVTTNPVEVYDKKIQILSIHSEERCEITFSGDIHVQKEEYLAHDGTQKFANLIQIKNTLGHIGEIQLTFRIIR